MEGLKEALETAQIKIIGYNPSKARPIKTSVGLMDVKKFSVVLREKLGADMMKYPGIFKATHDLTKMEQILDEYVSSDEGLIEPEPDKKEIIIPPELQMYRLNKNKAAKKPEDKFFLTTEDEFISRIDGGHYIDMCGGVDKDSIRRTARCVFPEYRPRGKVGVEIEINRQTKEKEEIFNTYIPPRWSLWRKENPVAWAKLPKRPPKLFIDLLLHLIPVKKERQYFYAWLYASITSRSYVYLVLCGAPGSGKNRLKLVMRALHGSDNTIDGKKSTLTERFNSQLSKGTLTWFDELKYDSDMENIMKEMQNDYLSIERKGIDATMSSTIHSSMVISNNKPRDNFIAFDARKFAPLMIGERDLKFSMSPEEIETLNSYVDIGKDTFNVKFVAQIAKWILSVGPPNLKKFRTLEYKGPMFWTLAHTSMARWQKKAITALIDKKTGNKIGWDVGMSAHLWSKVEEKLVKRSVDPSSSFPDYSTVRAFFEVFRDGEGVKAFRTKLVEGNNILGDFWIYPLTESVEIITENTVAQDREKGRSSGEESDIQYDL